MEDSFRHAFLKNTAFQIWKTAGKAGKTKRLCLLYFSNQFFRRKERNTRIGKAFSVTGNNTIAGNGLCTNDDEGVLEIRSPEPNRLPYVPVCHLADPEDGKQLFHRVIAALRAMQMLPNEIKNIRDAGSSSISFYSSAFTKSENMGGRLGKQFPIQENVKNNIRITHDLHIALTSPLGWLLQ